MNQKSEALEELVKASRLPAAFFPREEALTWPDMDMRYTSFQYTASRHLRIVGWRGLGKGDVRPMFDAMVAALRIAHQFRTHDVPSRLSSLALAESAYTHLLHTLQRSDDPGRFAAEVLVDLVDADATWALPAADFSGDRLGAYLFLAEISEWDASASKARISPEKCEAWSDRWNELAGFKPETGAPTVDSEGANALVRAKADTDAMLAKLVTLKRVSVRGWENVDFAATLALFDEFYDALTQWARLPYWEGARNTEILESTSHRTDNVITSAYFHLSSSPVWSYRSLAVRIGQLEALQRGLRCTFAIWDHRHRLGRFPETLNELRLPRGWEETTDPFSGKPFVYRPEGNSFVLYSLGPDSKDDGGKHDAGWGLPKFDSDDFGDVTKASGDFVFWPWEIPNPDSP
jgi:hypothetical protein